MTSSTSTKAVALAELHLPAFGTPTSQPDIPDHVYRQRLAKLYARAREAQLGVFVVYGDREHFANLAYLTGYDPRFEEALLILNIEQEGQQKPLLLVGNEGFGYTGISPIKAALDIELYQTFSLLGQDRSRSRALADILAGVGVRAGKRVGVAGWKHFSRQETQTPETWLEVPGYLVDTLRTLTGGVAQVINRNDILMDSRDGLRTQNEVEQLACFEFASTLGSEGVKRVVFDSRPGMTEFEAAELMQLNAYPLACHINLVSGARAFMGLPSPTMKRLQHGDPMTNSCGLWGSMTSRAGFLVANAHELPDAISDYVKKLVAPYFAAIVAWYETLGIGVKGDALYRAIHDRIGDPFFGVKLNPGHHIHLDEWVSSPVYAGSTEELRSGMALQADVIPATGTPYYTTNIEDGIALADEALRRDFALRYPEAWGRIQARRAFMQDKLGIQLRPEVLPLSNLAGYLPPFWLSAHNAMRVVG
jgi:hypothetical protein